MEKNKVMREIKFRAKDTLERNWYVGSYIFTDDNTNNPFRSRPFKESHRIIFYSSGDWNMGGWSDVEIDPSTLGQYTGLKDKNGKEIYEGDILKHSYWDKVPLDVFQQGGKDEYIEEVLIVKYSVERGCYLSDSFTGIDIWICEESEVIGNIYDNPELINKEE